jgi:DNA-binding winged helix-turn-helix (wHTH) protein
MWFGLLGPLQVQIDDREVCVPGARQRVVLAALLLTPGQAVSAARMCELVWDGRPPAQAAVTLRSYVKRLRQALGPPGRARITTTSSGYQIDAGADQIDIAQFDTHIRTGIAAAQSGDWRCAAGLLDQALPPPGGHPVPGTAARRGTAAGRAAAPGDPMADRGKPPAWPARPGHAATTVTHRRAPAPRAIPRPAHGGAVPVWPAG